MVLQVAVVDEVSTYRRGLAGAVNDAGLMPHEPLDVLSWGSGLLDSERAVLIALRKGSDHDLLTSLALETNISAIVALLPDPSVLAFSRALTCGASAAVAYDAPAETVLDALKGALGGHSQLPVEIAQELASAARVAEECSAVDLTPREVDLLTSLMEGTRVAEIAQRAGYSERATFRQLASLYARMSVANRSEAIAVAVRWGVVPKAHAG